MQLLFKAAYHFESYEVEVVSAYRKPGRRREGPHGTGAAVDFRLRGVKAAELAAFLREQPRTGDGNMQSDKAGYEDDLAGSRQSDDTYDVGQMGGQRGSMHRNQGSGNQS